MPKRLQALYDKLVEAESERSKGGLSKLRRKLKKGKEDPVKGLYSGAALAVVRPT